MPFVKGQKGIGGARPNSGPPPDWLRRECQKAIHEVDGIGFLKKVVSGKPVPNGKGDNLPASSDTVARCLDMLFDRGYGKALQTNLEMGVGDAPKLAKELDPGLLSDIIAGATGNGQK